MKSLGGSETGCPFFRLSGVGNARKQQETLGDTIVKQRNFPWIQALSPPTDAPRSVVAQCAELSYGTVVRIALEMKAGGPWSDAWLASRLGVSRGYFSRILSDKQPMPEWMLRPIAFATGSNLILQFHKLQEALSDTDDTRALIRRIAQQAAAYSHPERRHEARAA